MFSLPYFHIVDNFSIRSFRLAYSHTFWNPLIYYSMNAKVQEIEIWQSFKCWYIVLFIKMTMHSPALLSCISKSRIFVAKIRKYNIFLKSTLAVEIKPASGKASAILAIFFLGASKVPGHGCFSPYYQVGDFPHQADCPELCLLQYKSTNAHCTCKQILCLNQAKSMIYEHWTLY